MESIDKPKHRFYKTIGIDDVFLEQPDPALFPQQYLEKDSSNPFLAHEIVGKLKCSAEDFVVREIAKKDRIEAIPGDLNEEEKQAFRVADLVDVRPLKSQEVTDTVTEKEEKGSCQTEENSNKKDNDNNSLLESDPLNFLKNMLAEAAKRNDQPEKPTPEEIMDSLQSLQAKSLERIKALSANKQPQEETASKPTTTMTISPTNDDASAFDKGKFHFAFRFAFPLLQANSKANSNEIEVTTEDFFDEIIPFLFKPEEDLPKMYQFHKKGPTQNSSLQVQRGNSRKHFQKGNSRKRDRPDATTEQQTILRLQPDLSKDQRRAIHTLLASKSRAFQTSTLSDYPLEDGSTEKTSAIAVSWNVGAQKRARKMARKDPSSQNPFPHTLCVVKKKEKEHLSAITALSSAIKCRSADVGLAGIKDMKAVTYQYCTFRNTGPMRLLKAMPILKPKGIEIGTIRKVDFFLNTGDLEGNRFDITVRGIQRVKVESDASESFCACERQYLEDCFERVKRFGFVNFYGEQRVGAPGDMDEVGVRTFDVGRAMLQRNFSKAIDLIMTGRSITHGRDSKEDPNAIRVRMAWKESGGDPVATLKEFPRGENMPRERALMKGLNRYGKEDPLAAIQCLPYNVRRFWINAYQSFVWNTMASGRMKLYGSSVVVGDLYKDDDSIGTFDVKIVTEENISKIRLEQVVLPLPGFGIQYPENEVGALYSKLLSEDGIVFQKQGDDESTAKGGYRHVIAKATNMQLRLHDGESESSASIMNVQFDLPSGCYATMLFRELMFTTVARD